MLARTIDARATRDIDVFSVRSAIGTAVEEIKEAAALDLDDFIRYEYTAMTSIKADDRYRDGVTLVFTPFLGSRRMHPVSIDLVVDELPLDGVDWIEPVDRLLIHGLPVSNYAVYPVAAALADKFCGVVEKHGGRASSRVKDLVDILIYIHREDVDAADLSQRLRRESGARGLELPPVFDVPELWYESYGPVFKGLLEQTGLAGEWADLQTAVSFVAYFYQPILGCAGAVNHWDHRLLAWS